MTLTKKFEMTDNIHQHTVEHLTGRSNAGFGTTLPVFQDSNWDPRRYLRTDVSLSQLLVSNIYALVLHHLLR